MNHDERSISNVSGEASAPVPDQIDPSITREGYLMAVERAEKAERSRDAGEMR